MGYVSVHYAYFGVTFPTAAFEIVVFVGLPACVLGLFGFD